MTSEEPLTIGTMPTSVGLLTFSGRPDAVIFEELRTQGLDVWWNLAAELGDLLPEMKEVAREVLWARIPDYSAPNDVPLFMQQLETVCLALRQGGHVHVSCLGGRGRTGMALACIRVVLEGDTPEAALEKARKASGGPEVPEQEAFVVMCAGLRRP